MFRIFFIGVVLFQVFGGTFSNGDCDVLSDICRRDPECADDEAFARVLNHGRSQQQTTGRISSRSSNAFGDTSLFQIKSNPVFYSKCMESYGKRNSQDIADQPVAWATKDHPNAPVYIEKRRINYNHFYNGGAQQQQDGVRQQGVYDEAHQKDRIEKLKDLYSDYEKESIRESLLLLKEKLNQRKDTVGVGGEVDPRRFAEKGDAVDSTSQTHGEPNKADTFGKYVNIHKKESDDNNNNNNNDNNNNNNKNIQAKYDDTTNNLQIITTNTDNEITHNTIRQKNDDINNYQTLLNSDNQKDSSVNYDEGVFNEKVNSTGNSNNKVISNDELVSTLSTTKPAYDKEKKSKIINQAFDLVQSMIKERDGDVSVNDPSATPSLVEKQGDELEVYTKPVVSNKRDSVAASQQAADAPDERAAHDKSIVIGSDRSEVAVAEYSTELEERRDDDEENRGLVIVRTSDSLPDKQAVKIGKLLQNILWNITQHKVLQFQSVEDESNAVYRMKVNTSWFKFADNAVYVATKINTDDEIREDLNRDSGAVILSAESTSEDSYAEAHIKDKERKSWDQLTLFSAVIAASVLGLLFAAIVVCVIKRKAKSLTPFIFKRQEAVQDYQELCRTQMSVANSPRPEDETDKNSSMKTWNDEQSPYNMDITTGHVILSYMEDHLKNENRLNKEWEALCNYKADQSETHVGSDIKHATKNRYRDVLPYDHTRVHLRSSANAFHSDYINASFITDTDPKNPSYIATQGPLDNTVADFWQMIWEQGVVVIINLTKLSDMGLPQCHHYWPTDGSEVYHIYEVHLISEHIWCDDYLVRNIYLKNLQTAETRTVTQFHYLTWPDLSIPTSPKPLLEFRRKVNKCYRGHACPVVVHCNNGVGRTGTYILLDMVLNKMIKGTKEIDIAATLEHLRDQRQDVVKTKGQFEFALLAVAEEVTAILSSVAR